MVAALTEASMDVINLFLMTLITWFLWSVVYHVPWAYTTSGALLGFFYLYPHIRQLFIGG